VRCKIDVTTTQRTVCGFLRAASCKISKGSLKRSFPYNSTNRFKAVRHWAILLYCPDPPLLLTADAWPLPQILKMGRAIGARAPALAYDRAVVQHVYLGAALDLHTLPPFCTDSQEGCLSPHVEGIGGNAWRRTRRRSNESRGLRFPFAL